MRSFLCAEVLCANGEGIKTAQNTFKSFQKCVGYVKKSFRLRRILEKVFKIASDMSKYRRDVVAYDPEVAQGSHL